jgi:hypothetical protein
MLCIKANIGTCSKVSDMFRDPGIFSACKVRDDEEVWQADQMVRHSKAELLDLAMNVVKEGVAEPMSDQHDHEYMYASQVHGHCGSGSNGMCSNFICFVSHQ